MDRRAVEQWVDNYQRLWRTPETDGLADLFLPNATYLPSPWARPVNGLEEIAHFWDDERDGPDEDFTMAADIVAVDGETAVVRVSVDYGDSAKERWRDLWVIRFGQDGRCSFFEEWPFAPSQPDGHAPGVDSAFTRRPSA
ncbi:MAG: nuclear transport factor 2 family protein [Nocardioides sp.]